MAREEPGHPVRQGTTSRSIGLVKFDFLGLRTLTIIDWAVKAINARRAAEGREAAGHRSIPLTDKAELANCSPAATQWRCSSSNRAACAAAQTTKPDRFEDIIALVALYRRPDGDDPS